MDELRSQRVSEKKLDSLSEPFQLADLPTKYRQKIMNDEQEKNLEQLLQELDSMIGLSSVKQAIK